MDLTKRVQFPRTYFITICTKNREELFGEVDRDICFLEEYGEIAQKCWMEIPIHFTHAFLDAFIIMPDHMHGIIGFHKEPWKHEKFAKPVNGSLSTIIRSYKSAVTKQINSIDSLRGEKVWQRGFYEHRIRTFAELKMIRKYIADNPWNWDRLHANTRSLR